MRMDLRQVFPRFFCQVGAIVGVKIEQYAAVFQQAGP